MKKLKLILSLLIILALLSGLFVRNLNQNKEITRQEFLFDTLCTITVYEKADEAAIDPAFERAAEIHRLADFFDVSSEVSKINRAKANVPVKVDPDIMNMLTLAQDIFEKSTGAFDPSIAPISRLWKFDGENPAPPTSEQIEALLPLVGFDKLEADSQNMTVQKKLDNLQIDLGAIAKGYGADKAAEALKSLGVNKALIDFGGNIITLGDSPKGEAWQIGLQTPYAPTGEYDEVIGIYGGRAIVTSGTYQRYFEHNNIKYHHIINPKTGYPANKLYESVTVIADNAALADCLATAIFVMGEGRGKRLAAQYGAEVYFLSY